MGLRVARPCRPAVRSLVWRRPAGMARVLSLVLVAGLLQVLAVGTLPETAAHADEPKAEASEEKALAAAKRSGEPVEITSRRGETRTVRALPNGRIEVEERLQPIRAR